MLKKLTFILSLLFALNSSAQSENFQHKFTYLLTYQPTKEDPNSKNSVEMVLLRNRKGSAFLSKNEFISDSLFTEIKNKRASIDVKMPKTRFPYKIIKDNSDNTITTYYRLFMDTYQYEESKKNIQWKIHTATKKVNGFLCQKATTTFSGRHYTAWFTNEIPVSDGPYKFSGLPGLIVKIADSKNHYTFELLHQIRFNYNYPNLIPTKNVYTTDKKTFLQKHEEYKKNIVSKLSQSGFTLDEEHRNKIREKYNRRNNPIELGGAWYLGR
jgi:GLPGLI family protein